MEVDKIIIKSSQQKTQNASLVITLVGLLLTYLTYKKLDVSRDYKAGFYLGIFLSVLGCINFFINSQIEITIDSTKKRMIVLKKSKLSSTLKSYTFEQIASVNVKSIGRRSSGLRSHYLYFQLKNKQSIASGKWSYDQNEMSQEAQDLALLIGCECMTPPPLKALTPEKYLISAMISIAIYCIFYRVNVGPFCPAMWFGTAPIFIMGLSFITCVSLFRRV